MTKEQLKMILDDQGGAVINWNYAGTTATLRAQMGGHPPIVIYEDIDGEEVLQVGRG